MPLNKLPIKISAGQGLSMIDRAVKEMFASRCTNADLRLVRDYFAERGEICCLYCGHQEPNRWDHLHPMSKGGDTVPGNLVPSCDSCDDSKQDRNVEEWLASSSKRRPPAEELGRIQREIADYQSYFRYTPVAFEEKLSKDQKATYEAFQLELQALRSHLQAAGIMKVKK